MNCQFCADRARFSCSKCTTFYCGNKCQLLDWHTEHQFTCDARILQPPGPPRQMAKLRERKYPNMHLSVSFNNVTKNVHVYFFPRLSTKPSIPPFDSDIYLSTLTEHMANWDYYVPPDFFTTNLGYGMFYILMDDSDYALVKSLISYQSTNKAHVINPNTGIGAILSEFVQSTIAKDQPKNVDLARGTPSSYRQEFEKTYVRQPVVEWIRYFKRIFNKYSNLDYDLVQEVKETCPVPFLDPTFEQKLSTAKEYEYYLNSFSLEHSIAILKQLRSLRWPVARVLPENIWNLLGETILPGEQSKISIIRDGEHLSLFHARQTTEANHDLMLPSAIVKKFQPFADLVLFDFDKVFADFNIVVAYGGHRASSFLKQYINFVDLNQNEDRLDRQLRKEAEGAFNGGVLGVTYSFDTYKKMYPNYMLSQASQAPQLVLDTINEWKSQEVKKRQTPEHVITFPGKLMFDAMDTFFHEVSHAVLGHTSPEKMYAQKKNEFQAVMTSFICHETLGYLTCPGTEITMTMSEIFISGVDYIKSFGIDATFLDESNPKLQKWVGQCIHAADKIIRSGLHLSAPAETKWKSV